MYQLETNEGVYFVSLMPSLEQKVRYFTRLSLSGMPVGQIKFQVRAIHPVSVEGIVVGRLPRFNREAFHASDGTRDYQAQLDARPIPTIIPPEVRLWHQNSTSI